MLRSTPGPRAGRLLALLLLGAPAAFGQGPQEALGLKDAVRLTLERSPAVMKARADVDAQAGSLQSASGAYDLTFTLRPSLSVNEGELEPRAISNEDRRRTLLTESGKSFLQLRDAYAENIRKQRYNVPSCPGGFTLISVGNFTGVDSALDTPICAPIRVDPGNAADPTDYSRRVVDYLLPRPSYGVGTVDYSARLAQIYGMDLQSQVDDLRQRGLELLEQGYRLSEEGRARAALGLERLGPYPETEFRKTLSVSLGLAKALPFGPVVQAQVQMSGTEDNYHGKPLDPSFGGAAVQTTWRVGTALALSVPLRKGAGRVSAEAPRRSARANLEAARRQYAHTLADQALQTAQAYLQLVAAQETLALLEQSAEHQRQLLEATRALVAAGEQARTELTRAMARLADAERNVEAGRQAVIDARVQLAQTMGLTAAEIGPGFSARASFGAAPREPDVPALAGEALLRRNDVRASEAQRDSAAILFEAARNDTKRKLDLTLRLSYGSDYYGPFFWILPDEHRDDTSNPKKLSAVDYYEPEGFKRALEDRWKPGVSVGITWELPFGNRQAKGRLLQSRASLDQSEIQLRDLGRTIGENLIEQATSLRRAKDELERRREAVSQHESSWEATRELLKAGDLSLIDAIKTEQNLTSARLQLVRAQQDYATLIAQIRFETGTLVPYQGEQVGEPDLADLVMERGPS